MVIAVVWTLVGVILAGIVALAVEGRSGRRSLEAGLRAEMRGVRDDLHTEIQQVRTGIQQVRTELRGEFRTEFQSLRDQLGRIAEAQAEMNGQLVVLRSLAHTHDAS